jgi:hypothetical protein
LNWKETAMTWTHDDAIFVRGIADPLARDKAIRLWKTQRTWTLVAFCAFVVGALLCFGSNSPGLCGLNAALAAINLATTQYCDVRIKLLLLAAEIKKV